MTTLYARDRLSHDTLVANVVAAWERTTDDERLRGCEWYADARVAARSIAILTGRSLEHGAAVIAVLSPQTEWHVNLREAWDIAQRWTKGIDVTEYHYAAYPANVAKAWSILEDHEHYTDYIGGPKVNAFFRAIAGLAGGPVIDRHATRVATDMVYDAVTTKTYYEVQDAYVVAAHILNVDVHTLQAATWLGCKRELASTRGQLVIEWAFPDRPSSF